MYPAKFEYEVAESLDAALAGVNDEVKVLAGGHSLIPAMKLRLAAPEKLLDISKLSELKGVSSDGNGHQIGALTTHTEVIAAAGLPGALREAAGMIGDPQVRNRGTVGGNIAHADPASDLPTVFTALNATINMASASGTRSVVANEFFTGLFETALNDNEIVTSISVPDEGGKAGSCYAKLFNPASRYAMVGCAAAMGIEDGKVSWVRVAVGGLTPNAQRCPAVEAALVGKAATDENIAAAAEAVSGELGDDVMGDIHASADYRRAVCPEFVARALTGAAGRCG